jgi:hypothetical protein
VSLYKKLPCVCKHAEEQHRCGPTNICLNCLCFGYDAAGHNPDLENVLCPSCKLVHLEKIDKFYICISCNHTMSEKAVWELVG